MSKSKKLISSLLAAIFTVILLLPSNQTVKARAISAPEVKKPRINVTYTLKDGVQVLPEAVSPLYNKNTKLLTLPSNIRFNPNVNQIYVDMQHKTALKIKSIQTDTKGIKTITTETPELNDVLKDFNIPRQTVALLPSDAVILHQGVTPVKIYPPTASAGKTLLSLEDPPSTQRYDLSDFVLFESGDSNSNNYIKATVNGFIEFQSPSLTIDANFWNYNVNFNAFERSQLNLEVKGKLNQDLEVPLVGYPLDFGIGGVSAAVYLHCSVNGEIDIRIGVEQGVSIDAGIHGDSIAYIPRNVDGDFDSSSYFTVTPSIQGKIDASFSVRCKAELRILEVSAGLYLDLGVKGTATVSNARVDLSIKAFIDFEGGIAGHNYTFYYDDWAIYESHEQYTAGYKIALTEVNAYTNNISGTVTKNDNPFDGFVFITIKHQNGIANIIKVPCTAGVFSKATSLVPQDKVSARVDVTEVNVTTGEVNASVPFSSINLVYADAFNDRIKIIVPGGYTGPATIVKTTAPATKQSKSVTQKYPVTINNGQLMYNTTVKGGQSFYVYIDFENLHIVSSTVNPTLPFVINLDYDTTGTSGTVKNMHGITPYLGKVTILYTKYDTRGNIINNRVKKGEVNAVAINNSTSNTKTGGSSTLKPFRFPSGVKINRSIIDILLHGGSSKFTFTDLKMPSPQPLYVEKIYAVIVYEGISVEQEYVSNPPQINVPRATPKWELNIDELLDRYGNPASQINSQ